MSDEQRTPQDERAERRDRRKEAEKQRVRKHGARLAEVYRNAILKRLGRRRPS